MKTANKHTISDLKQMQSLPLDAKIKMTQRRIQEWVDEFGEDGVYVSFSGGKDSTVLLDIARKLYPDIEAIYINTGLEYPSVRQFALSKENVTEIRPNMNFRDVIIKYGYPIISKEVSQTLWEAQKSVRDGRNTYTYRLKKLNGEAVDKEGNPSQYNIPQWKFLLNAPFNISHKCCDVMKKNPAKKYENDNEIVGIIATMADESRLRQEKWLKNGCNAFELKRPQSNPMSFWTEQDVLTYIHTYRISIASAYGQVVRDWDKDGLTEGQINLFEKYAKIIPGYELPKQTYKTTGRKRTGCIFCGFGITQDKQRFVRLADQEPKLCDYVMRGGEFSNNGMWQPNKDGLGYWFVLEWLNVHGNLGIGIPNKDYYMDKYCTEQNRKHLNKMKVSEENA